MVYYGSLHSMFKIEHPFDGMIFRLPGTYLIPMQMYLTYLYVYIYTQYSARTRTYTYTLVLRIHYHVRYFFSHLMETGKTLILREKSNLILEPIKRLKFTRKVRYEVFFSRYFLNSLHIIYTYLRLRSCSQSYVEPFLARCDAMLCDVAYVMSFSHILITKLNLPPTSRIL